MKINEGQGSILQQAGRREKINKTHDHENDFKKIMEQIHSPIHGKEPIIQGETVRPVLNGIDIIRGTEKVQEPIEGTDKRQVLGTLKETLDLVDFYSSKLGDSSFLIDGLTPLIGHLEERLETLRGMESSPDVPEKMRPVISDLSITIGAEIERFKRGDYL